MHLDLVVQVVELVEEEEVVRIRIEIVQFQLEELLDVQT